MIELISFSYKHGQVPQSGVVIDCRAMKNPFFNPELRPLNGLDPRVQRYCMSDPKADSVLRSCVVKAVEGGDVTLSFGCTGGTHRSVTLVELIGKQLADKGCKVRIRHLAINVEKDLP